MANSSIYAAFERMWQHILNVLSGKSDVGHTHSEYLSTTGTAAKATADASGNNIVNTYATKTELNNAKYTLPNATSSTLGGVKIGSNITVSSGTISLSKTNVTSALGYTPPETNTTYSVVSTTADGLAPKRDGSTTKFLRADGTWAAPPTGSTITVDSSLSSTSTNPVQNKVINSALGGKAPTSHATSSTTYGAGSSSNYGHVKLSDSTSSTSGASSGVAATPTAVKSAYDLANKAMPKSGGTFTGDITIGESADIVYPNIMLEGVETDIRLGNLLQGYGETLAYFGDNVMFKSGGQFTGTVEQYWEDTSVACLRGNSVLDGAWQPVSTCDITFIRK